MAWIAMPSPEPIVVNHLAISRRARRSPGVAAAAVVVDDRTLESLLDFAVEFGRFIRFVDFDDEGGDRDWSGLLAADAAMALGSMVATDVDALEARFDELQRRALATPPIEEKLRLVRQAAGMVLDLVRKLDLWRLGLERAHPGDIRNLMLREVRSAIGELRKPIATLRGYDLAAARPDVLGEPLGCRYPEQWDDCIAVDEIAFDGATPGERLDWLAPRLDPMMAAAARAVDRLRDAARVSFAASLATGDHAPHVALLISFARLFAHAQASLNTLPRRYLDFYYREVLDGRPRGPTPDRIHVALSTDPAGPPVVVPAGSLFPAGEDAAGQPIVYGLDRDLTVGPAKLVEVRTIRVVRGPLHAAPGAPTAPCQVFATALDPDAAVAPWPTFGSDGRGAAAPSPTRPAEVGFAIRSGLLRLSGGRRRVSVEVRCAPGESAQALKAALPSREVWQCLLERCFRLRVSTADGWADVPRYDAEILPGSPSPGFRLTFTLPPGAPAVAPFDHALPALQFLVQPRRVAASRAVWIWPLAVLGALRDTRAEVRVDVEGLGPAEVRNTDGTVDPSQAFGVFGSAPAAGSFLAARHPELDGKALSEVRMDIGWRDRPPGGLGPWYHGYGLDPPPDELAFQGIVSVEPPPDTTEPADASPVPLFGAGPLAGTPGEVVAGHPVVVRLTLAEPHYGFGAARYPDAVRSAALAHAGAVTERERAAAASCGALTSLAQAAGSGSSETAPLLRELLAAIDPLLDSCPPERIPRARAQLRATLQGRDRSLPAGTQATLDAIGDSEACSRALALHVDAARLILGVDGTATPATTRAALEDLASRCREQFILPGEADVAAVLPNPPYVPMADRLTIGYSASSAAEILHLLPFGEVGRADGRLVPHFEAAGALLLRFEGLGASQSLPLLFQLAPPVGDAPPAQVSWWCRNGRGWQRVARVTDETRGLTHSGVVTLDLTGQEPAGGWLRATVDEHPRLPPATVAIHPFAASATRRAGSNGGPGLGSPLPAGTVTALQEPIAGIASVAQPLPSVGGREAEDADGFELRLSERLRHKDRAALPWDYERIVLERFPRVWKVAALPANGSRGTVVVVVVPHADTDDAGADRTAPLLPGEELAAIRSVLSSLAGPFVAVEVVNPVYRRVRVRACVEFQPGHDPQEAARRLNDELIGYLSPGFHDEAREAIGGAYVTRDGVAGFVQSRPYVACALVVQLRCAPHPGAWCFDTSAARHHVRVLRAKAPP